MLERWYARWSQARFPAVTHQFTSLGGSSFFLNLGGGRRLPNAPMFLSVAKAGSSLQTGVVEKICKTFDISFLNIAEQLFLQGIDLPDCPLSVLNLLEEDHVSTGF